MSESDIDSAEDVESPSSPSPKPVVQLTKKQELNNLIVLMRKKVSQARVHVISKLTREVKLLQKRKGPEKVQTKAKRKAERLIQEILVIKKLKKDSVSAHALQSKTSLLKTLQNLKSSPESRALARLAHHSAVQADVTAYRTQNPHWELQIPVLLEKSKEKVKKLRKKQEEREKKSIDAGTDTITTIEEDADLNEAEDTAEVVSEGKSKKEIIKPAKKPKLDKKSKQKLTESRKPLKIDKSEGTVRIQVLKDLVDIEKEDKSVVSEETEPTEPIIKKKPKSSFFVGGVDRPSPEKEIKQSYKPENYRDFSQQQNVFRKGKLIPNKHSTNNHRGTSNFKSDRPSRYFDQPNTQSKEIKRFDYSHNTQPIKAFNNVPTSSEKLHPSWEAKKRQASAITSFQGKKITFGDD